MPAWLDFCRPKSGDLGLERAPSATLLAPSKSCTTLKQFWNKTTYPLDLTVITNAPSNAVTFTSKELAENFNRCCGDYLATEEDVLELRAREYSLLDANNTVYLDYTGASLTSSQQVEDHMTTLHRTLLSNPHSAGDHISASQAFVNTARAEVLKFFNTTSNDYQVIFTHNATGALKLVGESFPFTRKSTYLVCSDNHNSVNGIEAYARPKGASTKRVPLKDCGMDGAALSQMLAARKKGAANLFAYPGQSNLTGVQHSLDWITKAQQAGWDVLLDTAAYCPTNVLDLSKHKPDFCCCSFYKLFGYPTGIGCLLVRKSALHRIAKRPWFAGGTVQLVYPDGKPMMMPTDGPDRWEDGTVAFTSMAAVTIGLRHLSRVGMADISARTKCLANWTISRMRLLQHANGVKLVKVHGPVGVESRGASIAFNLVDEEGKLISVAKINELAEEQGIMMRVGCMCNPHGAWHALASCTVQELRGWDACALPGKAGHSTVSLRELVPVVERNPEVCGICRISFGIVSTFADAVVAIEFLQGFIAEPAPCHLSIIPAAA